MKETFKKEGTFKKDFNKLISNNQEDEEEIYKFQLKTKKGYFLVRDAMKNVINFFADHFIRFRISQRIQFERSQV